MGKNGICQKLWGSKYMDVGSTEDVHLFVSDPKDAPHHDPIKN